LGSQRYGGKAGRKEGRKEGMRKEKKISTRPYTLGLPSVRFIE
jgi:hypothetical protein